MPVKKGKGTSDYMPVRKPPVGVKMPASKNIAPKPKTPVKTTTKAPVKKKVVQMPSKISPSKMTPAQKARYLKNPERYDG